MAFLVPNVGDVEFLKAALQVVNMNATMTLKLYSNNVNPAKTDTAATYTAAVGFGYVDKTLTGTSWSVVTVANVTSASYAQQTWTFTGALGLIYGYFIVRADTGILLMAEKFSDGPYNVANNGDQILLTPVQGLA